MQKLFKDVQMDMNNSDVQDFVRKTENYSFADIKALVKDAAMGPVRDMKQMNPRKITQL